MADGVVIQQSDVSVPDAFGLLGKSADDNRAKLDVLDASLMKIIEHQKLLLSNNDTTTQKGIQQLFEINEELNTQTQKAIKLEQDKLRLEKLSEQAKQAAIRTRQLESKEVENSIKKSEREAAAQEKASSAYNKVQVKLNTLRAEYKNLAVLKEFGAKLTDKEAKRYEFLQQRIQKYDGTLKAVDASMGQYGRNVGNYKSAFDGLGFSTQQLIRELPSAANSFQTFALAISNNIPMFTDEVRKLVAANKELAAAGKPTTSVLGQIGKSIFSITGIIGLAVTAFTFLAPKIADWVGSLGGGNKALEVQQAKQKAANEETKKATDFIGRESAGYINLIVQLKASNAGTAERRRLMGEVNKQYHVTLENIKDEAKFQEMLNNEILDYLEYQRLRYKQEKNDDTIKKRLDMREKDYLELQKLQRAEKDLGKAIEERKGIDIGAEGIIRKQVITEEDRRVSLLATQNSLGLLEHSLESNQERQNELNAAITVHDKRLLELGYTSASTDAKIRASKYTFEESTGAVERNTTAINANNIALSDQFDRLNDMLHLIQEVYNLKGERSLMPIDVEIANETVRLFEQIREEGEFNVDRLEKFIEGKYAARRKLAEDNAKFEIQQLQVGIDQRKLLEEERLRDERDKLLIAVDLSKVSESQKAADRLAIEQSYQDRLKDLFGVQLEEYKIFALQREKIELELKNTIYGLNKEQADQLNEVNEQLNDALEDRSDKTNAKVQAEYDKSDEVARKRFRLRLLYTNKSEEEITEAVLKNEIERLSQKLALESAAGHDTLDIELELAEKKRQLDAKELKDKKAQQKELLDLTKEGIDNALKLAIEASKEREKLIDKEISDSQKAADALRQQAAQGNADAKESLAALDDTIEEKQKLKQKEQQQQQLIEELQLLYDATQNYVEKGDSLPVAGSKALFQVTGLRALFKAALSGVKGFFGGTKRTVGEELGAPLFPGKDGHLIRVDGSEKILNPELSAKTGNATTDDIVAGYTLARAMSLGQIAPSVNYQHAMRIDSEVANKIDELTKVMKSKPDRTMSVELEGKIAKAVIVTERSGTRFTRTRHKAPNR